MGMVPTAGTIDKNFVSAGTLRLTAVTAPRSSVELTNIGAQESAPLLKHDMEARAASLPCSRDRQVQVASVTETAGRVQRAMVPVY